MTHQIHLKRTSLCRRINLPSRANRLDKGLITTGPQAVAVVGHDVSAGRPNKTDDTNDIVSHRRMIIPPTIMLVQINFYCRQNLIIIKFWVWNKNIYILPGVCSHNMPPLPQNQALTERHSSQACDLHSPADNKLLWQPCQCPVPHHQIKIVNCNFFR